MAQDKNRNRGIRDHGRLQLLSASHAMAASTLANYNLGDEYAVLTYGIEH